MGVYTLGKPIASADLSGSATRKVYISGDTPLANQIAIWVDENHITGSNIDTIETTLTNDDTHMPTSGAVLRALSEISGGTEVSFGSTTQIPYTNVTADDFSYSANFTYNGTTLSVGGLNITGTTIDAGDGADKDLTITAGDASGIAGTDGGDLILKAGGSLTGDIGSTPGILYLVPGKPYSSGLSGTIYLGDSDFNGAGILISPEASVADMPLYIRSKGAGELVIGQNSTSYTTIYSSSSIRLRSASISLGNTNIPANVVVDLGIQGSSGSPNGYDLEIKAGAGYSSGNGIGGDLILSGGEGTGYGADGVVKLNNNLVFPDNTIQYGAVSKATLFFEPSGIIGNTTGTLISAPGSGMYIVPICFYIMLSVGTTAYSGSVPTITMKYGNTTTICSITNFDFTASTNQIAVLYPTTIINGDLSDLDNKSITVSMSGGSLIDGDGWLNITAHYLTVAF